VKLRPFTLLLAAGCSAPPSPMTGPDGPDAAVSVDAGASPDASVPSDAGVPVAPCVETADDIACAFRTTDVLQRHVLWQLPAGIAPDAGWPAAVFFQGSFFGGASMWSAAKTDLFGAWYQTHVISRLLEAGIAVLAPEAHVDGTTYWDTNVPPFSTDWDLAPDNAFVLATLQAVTQGTFGPIDPAHLYAIGISSGGYMSSRMAVSYAGRFRAIAVHSGSYCTCSGAVCIVPELDPTHAPTLFLHGSADLVVPPFTMREYEGRLHDAGVETSVVIADGFGHEYIPAAPEAIRDWFLHHR
jgi:predicted esterase